nr:hypothetical protein Itr_chr06CG17590 [Ipomoea trifida]GLL33115.1 hypothetical protein Itr_chr08CG07940 [Ipomoea trifida]GMD22596.1 hypothetical protein Iba_chr08aCG12290 [Ipomoea batatas]
MWRLSSPPTLSVAAGGRHRSAHAARLVDIAITPHSSLALKPFIVTSAVRRRSLSLRWWSSLLFVLIACGSCFIR